MIAFPYVVHVFLRGYNRSYTDVPTHPNSWRFSVSFAVLVVYDDIAGLRLFRQFFWKLSLYFISPHTTVLN